MNSKAKRIVALVLAAILAGSVLFGIFQNILSTPKASAVTKDDLNRRKREIEELKSQKKGIETEKTQAQAVIDSLEYQNASALNKKAYLDNHIAVVEEEIDNVSAQISLYDDLIADQMLAVIEAGNMENEQWELYKTRMRELEEGGRISYLAVLLDSANFAEFLARWDFISEIMRSDELTYEDYVEAREQTEHEKAELERLQQDAESEKAELINLRSDLQLEVDESIAVIAQINTDLKESLEAYDALMTESTKIQKAINDANAKLEREQAQYDAAKAAAVKGTGSLAWPSNYSSYVTSLFGTRKHPIFGDWRTHNGIDIAGAGIYGTSVLAADGGTVTISDYSSSYGNYIVINHGNGTTTLYAHMSKRLVSVGKVVSKGDTIGKVGSTGNSTGAHLHFEVSVNGTLKNPLNYFVAGTYTVSPSA